MNWKTTVLSAPISQLEGARLTCIRFVEIISALINNRALRLSTFEGATSNTRRFVYSLILGVAKLWTTLFGCDAVSATQPFPVIWSSIDIVCGK